jgi:hypothetical protein
MTREARRDASTNARAAGPRTASGRTTTAGMFRRIVADVVREHRKDLLTRDGGALEGEP